MDLYFKPRQGNRHNWQRKAISYDVDVLLSMKTDAKGKRTGKVIRSGEIVWEGPVGSTGTPLRAFCVAAEMCDTNGKILPKPVWLV